MTFTLRFLIAALLCSASLCAVTAAWGQDDAPNTRGTQSATPSDEQIQTWIRQLGSQRYVSREKAARDLVESGIITVKPLVKSMEQGSIEMRMRALNVLRDLAMIEGEGE